MTDSSTGGYLAPTGAAPIDDDALDDFLQAWVVGITGIAGQYVRPRWQQDPPAPPPRNVTWAAIGITHRTPTGVVATSHDGSGDGQENLIQHEVMDLLCSFYGPGAQAGAKRLQIGSQLAQNREPLQLAGMGLIDVGQPTKAPDLLKGQWRDRMDLTLKISRAVEQAFPVLNLTSGKVVVIGDDGTETINIP